jgi:hypothetical protein
MATKQPLPGLPEPQLPQWAGANDTKLNGLPQTFLNKRRARPLKAGGGWLGDVGLYDPLQRGPSLPSASGIGASTIAAPTPGFSTATIAPDNNIAEPTTTPDGSGVNWNGVASGLNKLVPFASNIANAFRSVPKPIRSAPISSVTLSRVNNSNERANLDMQTRGEDLAADRGLAGNTASAVRAAGLSTKLRAYGDSYSRENNANADISNRQAEINSGIQEKNIGLTNQYNSELTASKIAQQKASAANISNAADKYIGIQNTTAQRNLDQQKWTDMSRLFNTGVKNRYEEFLGNDKAENARIAAGQKLKIGDEQPNDQDDNNKYGGRMKMAKGGKLSTSNTSNMKRLRKAY